MCWAPFPEFLLQQVCTGPEDVHLWTHAQELHSSPGLFHRTPSASLPLLTLSQHTRLLLPQKHKPNSCLGTWAVTVSLFWTVTSPDILRTRFSKKVYVTSLSSLPDPLPPFHISLSHLHPIHLLTWLRYQNTKAIKSRNPVCLFYQHLAHTLAHGQFIFIEQMFGE